MDSKNSQIRKAEIAQRKEDNPDCENPFYQQFSADTEDVSRIDENVFMGKRETTNNLDFLYAINLTDILSLGAKPHDKERNPDVTYSFYDIEDKHNADLLSILDECVNLMTEVVDNQGGRIFVHCHSGKSRSGSIVCAYYMKKNNWTFEQALEFVKSRRERCKPKEHFVIQLKQYEKMLKERQMK